MNYIDLDIKGFTLYCHDDVGEKYDFFIPKQDYRISKTEMMKHIPESHTLIDSKRSKKTITVNYDELLKISK